MSKETPRPFLQQDMGYSTGSGHDAKTISHITPGVVPGHSRDQQANTLEEQESVSHFEVIDHCLRQVARWSEVLAANGGEMLLYHHEEGYTTQPLEQANKHHNVALSVYSIQYIGSPEGSYEVDMVFLDEPFHDPYNHRPMSQLTITVGGNPHDATAPRYSLEVEVDYCDYFSPNADLGLMSEGVKYYVPRENQAAVCYKPPQESMSDPAIPLFDSDIDIHTRALFDYLDAIIPQATPQLPEPTAAQ